MIAFKLGITLCAPVAERRVFICNGTSNARKERKWGNNSCFLLSQLNCCRSTKGPNSSLSRICWSCRSILFHSKLVKLSLLISTKDLSTQEKYLYSSKWCRTRNQNNCKPINLASLSQLLIKHVNPSIGCLILSALIFFYVLKLDSCCKLQSSILCFCK